MKCPVCSEVDLVMTDRQSIEVDYCPQCRGVWLDRGELDKIIERSAALVTQPSAQRHESEPRRRSPESGTSSSRYGHDDDDDYRDSRHKKKRGGFLGELFDFG